jgi:DNA invertase Pin-like site-specific DNA recombinase
MATFTAYYRVSTAKQGQSGLGLEAQRATAQAFAASRGQIVEEFVEVESGKKNDRPKLAAAIAHSKATGSTLLIAKLDRLARNAGFIFALRDAGVDFVACDLPEASTMSIGIFAVLGAARARAYQLTHEGSSASSTRSGLVARQPCQPDRRGATGGLGSEQRQRHASTKGNRQAGELAGLYRAQGLTLQAIADKLNAGATSTRRGRQWGSEQVRRLLVRGAEA